MPRVDPRDPSTMPDPHVWATYVSGRKEKFKTHSSLAVAKNSISSAVFWSSPIARTDSWVYQWDAEAGCWRTAHVITRGTPKDQVSLFQQKVSRKNTIKGPSQAVVDKTIASIIQSEQNISNSPAAILQLGQNNRTRLRRHMDCAVDQCLVGDPSPCVLFTKEEA
jgi:hypothetical protein